MKFNLLSGREHGEHTGDGFEDISITYAYLQMLFILYCLHNWVELIIPSARQWLYETPM